MATTRVGLISDTHGLMRPQALHALEGADFIVHAGDIGKPDILDQLHAIAPIATVRGNNDTAPWATRMPMTLNLEIGGVAIHVLHDLKKLDADLTQGSCQVIVSGHSHRPSLHCREGVLFVNPGSAGPRRFTLPVSLAWMEITDGKPKAQIVMLEI